MLAERRRFPRVYHRLALEIVLVDGSIAHGTLVNISRNGVAFECTAADARRMAPPARTPEPFKPVELRVHVALSIGGGKPAPLEAAGRVVAPRRMSETSYHVGVEFTGIDLEGIRNLERFLEEHAL